MVSRRNIAILIASLLVTVPLTSFPQQPATKIRRIGYLQPVVPQDNSSPFLEDLRQGLRGLGYTEGKDVQLEIRIVMPLSSDPVGDGLVASLARPGGNITGLSMMTPDVGAKRLQLLKEVFPKPSRPVAVLWNPDYVGMAARFRQTQRVAPAVGMDVRSVEVRDSLELERALQAMEDATWRHCGLIADSRRGDLSGATTACGSRRMRDAGGGLPDAKSRADDETTFGPLFRAPPQCRGFERRRIRQFRARVRWGKPFSKRMSCRMFELIRLISAAATKPTTTYEDVGQI